MRYRETESPPLPSSRGRVGVLEVGARSETGEPTAIVYYVQERIKRVELSGGKPRRVWKRKLWQAAERDACARVGDVVVFGGKDGGLEGVRLTTGEQVWLLKHPSRIAAVPVVVPGDRLLVVFDDQTWQTIDPRSGKPLAAGEFRSEHHANEVVAAGHPPAGVFRRLLRTASGHSIVGDAVADDEGRRVVHQSSSVAAIEVVGDHIVAALRSLGETPQLGAAIIDSKRFEIDSVVDLGDWPKGAHLDGTSTVDNCVQIRLGDRVHVIDPSLGRELVRIDKRSAAVLLDDGREINWRGRL